MRSGHQWGKTACACYLEAHTRRHTFIAVAPCRCALVQSHFCSSASGARLQSCSSCVGPLWLIRSPLRLLLWSSDVAFHAVPPPPSRHWQRHQSHRMVCSCYCSFVSVLYTHFAASGPAVMMFGRHFVVGVVGAGCYRLFRRAGRSHSVWLWASVVQIVFFMCGFRATLLRCWWWPQPPIGGAWAGRLVICWGSL